MIAMTDYDVFLLMAAGGLVYVAGVLALIAVELVVVVGELRAWKAERSRYRAAAFGSRYADEPAGLDPEKWAEA